MKLPDLELQKIEKKYGYLVNETLDFDLKIGQARGILDIIFNYYKEIPKIRNEFNYEMKAQKKRFAKKKKEGVWMPYEGTIKDSFEGWLNFFVLKKYIPENLKNSFSFIYREVSDFIHEKGGVQEVLLSIIVRLNKIITWLFQKSSKSVSFLKQVKLSQGIGSNLKKSINPKNKSQWTSILIACLSTVIVALALLYFSKSDSPPRETRETEPPEKIQDKPINSANKQTEDKTKTEYTGGKEEKNSGTKKKPLSKPSTSNTLTNQVKTSERFNNNYALVTTQAGSEQLDPALLNKILEKYKNQYQLITDNNKSNISNGFEIKTNLKISYKASKYVDDIISCAISFSYQIIKNSDKSIVKNYATESSGIGHSNSQAKQNAIQKLKI